MRDEYLRDPTSWPEWFKVKIREEAQKMSDKMVNELFWGNEKLQADHEIMQRLPDAWKQFLKGYATSFMKNAFKNQMLSMMVAIEYICPTCRENVQFTLTPDDLGLMLRRGWVSYVCPYAKGFFKHQIQISLGELFWYIVNGNVILITRSMPISTKKYIPLEK